MSEPAKFKKMFEPITIKNIEIRNRIAMAPLATGFVHDGFVTEQLTGYLAARARNDVGLIITSPAAGAIPPGASAPPTTPSLSNPVHMSGWADLIETIHAFGAKVFVQVQAGGLGRQVKKGVPTKAASAVPMRIPPENLPVKCQEFAKRKNLPSVWADLMEGELPKEMTVDEIVAAENGCAATARLIKRCGADGVELHFGHGYLAYSFLSPRTNIRKDSYGGSFENRIRFLTNVITKTRGEVGDSFIVGLRISGDEHMPGGLGITETSRIVKIAEDMGIDFLHLTGGCFEAAKWYLPDTDGTNLPEAEILKKTLKIPVITPGLHNPIEAERALQEGKTDMVSLGRPLIADPEWLKKVAEGRSNKIVKCIRCLTCIRRIRGALPMRCEVNPGLGLEQYAVENQRISAPHKKVFYYPEA